MPAWKKVITSGSDASLNKLVVGTHVSASLFSGSFYGNGSSLTSLPTQTANDFTTVLKNKLDAIEASADVTDATNVTSAGALMDSEVTTLTLVKALTPTMISGSHTALSSSIAADVAANTAKVAFPFSGSAQITGSIGVTGSVEIYRSGSVGDTEVFTIEGGFGTLFSVTDELSGSLFSVNDISGIPIFEVFSDDTVKIGTHNQEGIVVNGKNVVITGSLAVGALTGSVTAGRIDASNDVVAFSTSDRRWKDNITPIESPLQKLLELGGYEFDWREDSVVHGNKGHDVGVIAQEVEAVLPEAVQTRSSGMKAVRYEKIIPLLIETIKEQQKQIDELKNRIK
jgi:hypothetical protein